MEENTLCPVCEDVACDLVALSCGHSPCKDCLTRYWGQNKVQECSACPLCWKILSSKPRPNETIKKRPLSQDTAPPNRFCSRHGFPFSLYCVDDEELLCPSCQLGRKHNGHNKLSLKIAAQDRKVNIRMALNTLMAKLKGHKKVHVTLNEMTQHIKSQAWQTEREIQDVFEKLHWFLREEEEARITALKEEVEQKSLMLKERIERIGRKTRDINFVLDAMRTIEQALEAEDISFLQTYSNTMKRTWNSLQDPQTASSGIFSSFVTELIDEIIDHVIPYFFAPDQIHNDTLQWIYSLPQEPELTPGALMGVAKHLGNLKYRVWEKMLGTVQYTPVTLDPNTAPPCLSLSEGLTRVQYCTDNPQLPDNPERFTIAAEMLGSQGFTSGRHHWDVEVGDNTNWAVGVAQQSVLRKDHTTQSRTEGIAALHFVNGRYATQTAPISVQKKLRRVRVQLELDCWGRKVTFTDPVCDHHIATIKIQFTERVFPYFCSLCEEHPLLITPEMVAFISALNTLMAKLKGHKKVCVTFNEMTPHIKSQARQTEREIKDEFEKLHRFLREEEEARITVLKEEEEQKSQMLKERIEGTRRKTKEINFVLDAMRTIEQYCTDNPQLPDNPERFTCCAEMLGSQGFISGRHHWDVEVGDNTNWAVGVAKQSVLRKDHTTQSTTEGIAALHFVNGRYATQTGPISVQKKLRRVRVQLELDCWGRKVTFTDPVCDHHIDTIKIQFTERVFPYFCSLCEEHPLHITPEMIRSKVFGDVMEENTPSSEPRPNETIKKRPLSQDTAPPNRHCSLHGFPFNSYCVDDEELLCPSCQLGLEHNGHRLLSLKIAAQDRKVVFISALNTLMPKLKGHKKVFVTSNEMTPHMKSQAEQMEREIQDEFEKLHQFLREEEEARITALKEEEEQKSLMLKDRIERIGRKTKEINSLLDAMRTIEQALEAEDISFLQAWLEYFYECIMSINIKI
ncbi:hypothetical protein SKAU_G00117420 [Synaphobranchus kaupii]|uniref:Zinc-binding protein A33-like n=1 Tax=Synaphobranchus kaupii TaxID=118154 RepID=A0A9Q1FNC8_SYNKA|nr:hypothetical protein SKAU_G00117420 [Synaphobranchus kaupii]